MRGHTFYPLHLLMDKHADEQAELIDVLAERVRSERSPSEIRGTWPS
jgi:starvation-inducible DNA-binding protein